MLFDLRGRGRRRTVQVIYASLAVLMGGGLVFFGIGGSVGGGLFDSLQSNNSTSASDLYSKQVESLERRVKARPSDAALWAQLTRAQFQKATTGSGIDQASAGLTEEGRTGLRAAARAWERYLALDPEKPDDQVANLMVQAYGPSGLSRLTDATAAMEIVVEARPRSFALYAQLAQLAYLAGQTRKGDLASAKALDLAPKAQRANVKTTLDEAKAAAASSTSTTTTPAPTP